MAGMQDMQMNDPAMQHVQDSMGDQGGPPPGSGMKWQDVGEDQQALQADPSPLNVAAFVSYWGIENMPPDLMQGGGDTDQETGPGEPDTESAEY